jgi:hypothetical protein
VKGLITDEYRMLNAELHQRVPAYGTGGWKWAPTVALLAWQVEARTILDYGSGKGSLRTALLDFDQRVFDVREYDPAVPGKEAPPLPADVVCCLDVLEHVEESCIDSVLAHLFSLRKRVVLLDIACRVGGKKLADGRPAHVLVRPAQWWRAKLAAFGPVVRLPSPTDEFAAVMYG